MNRNMMVELQKMQKEMTQAQLKIENSEFTETAGGVVSVTLKGTKEIVRIEISPDFEGSSPEDLEMLSEMIIAASRKAYLAIDKMTEETLGKYNAASLGSLLR